MNSRIYNSTRIAVYAIDMDYQHTPRELLWTKNRIPDSVKSTNTTVWHTAKVYYVPSFT